MTTHRAPVVRRERSHDIATMAAYGMGILACGLLGRALLNVAHIAVAVLS